MRRALALALALAACGPAGTAVAPPASAPTQPVSARAPAPTAANVPTPPLPGLHLPDDAVPTRYTLDLTVDPASAAFSGAVDVELDVRRPLSFLWLDSAGLTITSAATASAAADVRAGDAEHVGLAFPTPLAVGPASVHLVYHGSAAPDLLGLYRQQQGNDWYWLTTMFPTYARRVVPCFDEPRWKTPWRVTLHVPETDVAAGNGAVREERDEGHGRKAVRFGETRPLPSYLLAIAVGPFDVVDGGTAGAAKVPVRALVPRGDGPRAATAAHAAADAIDKLEAWTGVPFPYAKLDVVGHPHLAYGAMENAGLIGADASSMLIAPDAPADDRQQVHGIVFHETVHQWFGDLVTMADFDEIWLNEGITTFLTDLLDDPPPAREHPARMHAVMSSDAYAATRAVRQPIRTVDDIHNILDDTSYTKGAAILYTMQSYVGAKALRAGMHRYLTENADKSGTTAALTAAISAEAGSDVAGIMSDFLDRPGLPLVDVTLACKRGDDGKVVFSQTRAAAAGSPADPTLWRVPICFRWGWKNDPVTGRACRVLEGQRSEEPLDSRCPDWLVANEGGAGYYLARYPRELAVRDLAPMPGRGPTGAERIAILSHEALLLALGQVAPGEASAEALSGISDKDPAARSAAADLVFAVAAGAPPDLRPKAQRWAAAALLPLARTLGWKAAPGEDRDTTELRLRVVPFVAHEGVDRAFTAEGRAVLARWQHDRTPDDHLGERTAAAFAADGDAAVLEALIDVLRQQRDVHTNRNILTGMANVRDPELLLRGFDAVVAVHPMLVIFFLEGIHDPKEQAVAMTFLEANWPRLAAGVPENARQHVAFALPLCDAADAAKLRDFFAPRLADIPGGQRELSRAVERIERCAARSAAVRPGYVKLLGGK